MSERIRNAASVCRILIFTALMVGYFLVITWKPNSTAARDKGHPETSTNSIESASLVARGRYLVENVAVCGNCHSPRDENGEPDRARRVEGAPLFFRPAQPIQDWPQVAPRLAGLPPANDAAIITLLTTGIWTDGKPLRQPMPGFHMTRSDAEAVLAYLRSL